MDSKKEFDWKRFQQEIAKINQLAEEVTDVLIKEKPEADSVTEHPKFQELLRMWDRHYKSLCCFFGLYYPLNFILVSKVYQQAVVLNLTNLNSNCIAKESSALDLMRECTNSMVECVNLKREKKELEAEMLRLREQLNDFEWLEIKPRKKEQKKGEEDEKR